MAESSPGLRERGWNRLLHEIEEGHIVPVVGPELLVVPHGGETRPLQDHLARGLAQALDLEAPSGAAGTQLGEVATAYLEDRGDPLDLYFELHTLTTKTDWPIPPALHKLAEIRHFDLFLSTTFDGLLTRAIDAARFGGDARTQELSYSKMSRVADLDPNWRESGQPSVYRIFGGSSTAPEYAVTEEDVLEFTQRLLRHDRYPRNLFDELRARHVLLLGCNFPDWLARFFFCVAKGERLFGKVGVRGVVADGVSLQQEPFQAFLKRRRTEMFEGGSALEFVDQLHERWMAAHGGGAEPEGAATAAHTPGGGDAAEPPPDWQPDAVFISYASEDRDAAVAIADALEGAGVSVWLDRRRLEAGDDFQEQILNNISQASYFLPVISRHTAEATRRFFWLEWNTAIEEARFRPNNYPFLQPIIVDDTPATSEHIPQAFRARHCHSFSGGRITGEYLTLTRSRIRDLKRARRGAS